MCLMTDCLKATRASPPQTFNPLQLKAKVSALELIFKGGTWLIASVYPLGPTRWGGGQSSPGTCMLRALMRTRMTGTQTGLDGREKLHGSPAHQCGGQCNTGRVATLSCIVKGKSFGGWLPRRKFQEKNHKNSQNHSPCFPISLIKNTRSPLVEPAMDR